MDDEETAFMPHTISNRAGVRLIKKSEKKAYYCIFPDVLEEEVLKGVDKKMARSFLTKKEILISPLKERYTTQIRIKNFGEQVHKWVYKIDPDKM